MKVRMRSAGMVVEVEADGSWAELALEACAGQEMSAGTSAAGDVRIRIETGRTEPLARHDTLRPLTRGAWSDGSTVVMADACGSGLDLALVPHADHLEVIASPRPSWRHRVLGVAAPDRRVLLHRAAALQYPALWWAGVMGRVPLHASAATVRGCALVFAGPGGVGKSTLLATVDPATDVRVSDNLCVSDGREVHGVLEPARRDAGSGRRMPHGRREGPWSRLGESLEPRAIVVLRRGQQAAAAPELRRIQPASAARELVGGTYAAGELRRYWSFAATVGLGTGLGPVHPPVAAVCDELAARTSAFELHLPSPPSLSLRDVVDLVEALAGEDRVGPQAASEVQRS